MLNFYGRRHPRNINNDQLKNLINFEFFLDKNKLKRFKTYVKNFDTSNLEIGFGGGENIFSQ